MAHIDGNPAGMAPRTAFIPPLIALAMLSCGACRPTLPGRTE